MSQRFPPAVPFLRSASDGAPQGSVLMPPGLRRAQGGGAAPEKVKILITGKLHKNAIELLNNPPPELAVTLPLEVVDRSDCSREVLLKEVEDAHVLVSRSETDVDAVVLRAGKALSVVARAAVGYGNIDCDLATELGVLVVNTPGKNTNSAAELTLALLLAVMRKLPAAHASTSSGNWNRHHFSGRELLGKTIGIVGLGHVGHRVAKFARGFDMRVLAYDPYLSEEVFRKNFAERRQTLEQLLAECDVLTVHVPLNQETRGMVGEIELRKMKPGAIVLNAARGGIVNEAGLLKVLEEGYLAGAGIDTWDTEPKPLAALASHPRVISTPHIGASTAEAQERIGECVAVQVLKALRGEIVDYPVNLPFVRTIGSGPLRELSVLAEKCARLASQLHDFQPARLRVTLSSALKEDEVRLLGLSVMKGFLARAMDEFVSYVNAERLFAKAGLQLVVEPGQALPGGTQSVNVEVYGAAVEQKAAVGAVLYDGQVPRITMINDFFFEIEPEGDILVIQNHDRPGVIGDVGTFLARNNINIAEFELSRNRRGGMAMSLVRTDGALTAELAQGLRKLPNVINVRCVTGL